MEKQFGELRERMAHLGGLLEGLREAVSGRAKANSRRKKSCGPSRRRRFAKPRGGKGSLPPSGCGPKNQHDLTSATAVTSHSTDPPK